MLASKDQSGGSKRLQRCVRKEESKNPTHPPKCNDESMVEKRESRHDGREVKGRRRY